MAVSKRRVCSGFESLALEVISEILARLPIEWIMVYKSVCKAWYSLINSNYFVKLQLSATKDRFSSSRLIFEPWENRCRYQQDGTHKLYLLDVQVSKVREIPAYPLLASTKYFTTPGIKITCSLDGLICLARISHLNPVVIYNPLVRGDYVILPETEVQELCSIKHNITLGFDHSINKYKAIRMCTYSVNIGLLRHSLFEVITIGEETSWRRMVAPYAGLIHNSYGGCGGIFHQGSIYWIIDKFYANGETSNGREYILEFDVTKEVFRVITFPHSMRVPNYIQENYIHRFNMRLQILGGSLGLMQLEGRLLHIWRLVRQNGTQEVVGYNTITIELPYKDATISAILCPKGNHDFLLLQTIGGFEPSRNRKGKRIKIKGHQFSYYYPYSKKNDPRFVYLSPSLQIPAQDTNSYSWFYKPSLISIKAASVSHS